MITLRNLFTAVSLVGLFLFWGCAPDADRVKEEFTVVVRLASEPDNLNPTRSRSSAATPIESHIIYPLAEYDPYTLELTPLLVESLASIDTIREGQYEGGLRFSYRMRDEAEWTGGKPVTGYDYAFTVKAALNPAVPAATWRGFLSFIEDVEVDPDDPRSFTVIVGEPYMLAEEITCNFNVLPRHIYDANGYLDSVALSDLSNDEMAQQLLETDERLEKFATAFTTPGMNRDTIIGSGPYVLSEWITGERIVLERKKDWWGDQVKNPPTLMQAHPDRIVYRIIPDEVAAISAIKDGAVDLVTQVTAPVFVDMRDDPQWQDKLDFFTPSLMQHYFLEINNRHPILGDETVREAIAMAIDYDAVIETMLLGMAERTVGPFHPSKPYYNRQIEPFRYDLEAAIAMLAEAGWTDTNNNGTVDKMIDGGRQEMDLDILVTQRAEGRQLALLIKESAAKAGIGINIETTDGSGLMQALRSRDFELMPLRTSNSPSIDDPYQTWHSDSDQPGGNNRSGFSDPEADRVIEQIRVATSEEERNALYLKFQEILHEENPAVFLYVPTERIIVNSRIEMRPSVRRPGYFENLFELGPTT